MTFRWLAVLLAGSLSACASMPVKKQAAEKLTDTAQLLTAAREAEHRLCSSTADATRPATRCDSPQAAAAGLTDARHQALERALTAALDAHSKAVAALEAWKAGEPPPPSLHEVVVSAEAALVAAQDLTPDASVSMIADSLRRAIDAVASVQGALTAG